MMLNCCFQVLGYNHSAHYHDPVGTSLDYEPKYVFVVYLVMEMLTQSPGIFIRESHSRIYSPEVFALSQLVSEVPYSILCAILYWVLMIYPIGFGSGSAGLNGTGFQLLAVLFVEFFGVTLGQLIGAISPSIQVSICCSDTLRRLTSA